MKQNRQACCKNQQCQRKSSSSAKMALMLPAAPQRSLSTALPQQMPTWTHRSQRTQEEFFVTRSLQPIGFS